MATEHGVETTADVQNSNAGVPDSKPVPAAPNSKAVEQAFAQSATQKTAVEEEETPLQGTAHSPFVEEQEVLLQGAPPTYSQDALSRWAVSNRLKPDDIRLLQALGVAEPADLEPLRGLAIADLFDLSLDPPPSVVQKARIYKALNSPALKDEP